MNMATKIEPLSVKKLADKTDGERVTRFDPETGQPKPWPFAGLEIIGDPPERTQVASKFVTRGQAEGWIEVINPRMVHRPGGPPEEPWRVTHTFMQADAIVFKCVEGDVRYEVVHQPDKYDDQKDSDDETLVTDESYAAGQTRIDWFFELKLVR
jgi:hypothetical protein